MMVSILLIWRTSSSSEGETDVELTPDSRSEKPARAALFTAATRSLTPSTITILDSANYIKGFRYQLYCAAREAGVRVTTVHPVAPPEKCTEWEEARGRPYKPET